MNAIWISICRLARFHANAWPALRPPGQPALGAAVRHATALIEDQSEDIRAILMVTDGAPADIDVTRDAYLLEDARVAVQHARRAGIHCFGIALDTQADSYVRRIFGQGNYLIAVAPDFLQQRLKSVLAKLVRL
ncbi:MULTISPECIES: hypothetical protein [unclassified Paraburkholderia]|uniref:hypothetical protein n=1 Tax=unclassified Paraburkholderia TaxID=2615204 RepID=UPI0016174325|nr:MULTISPECIES: hypothetical protein [unclassified Paraburkholderia]MBB5446373.1 nitric oxide reductase activation protein [Paraburkholderia sp. WSM4177]MBB5487045.1 nitric oxide reductase activation protein [Paraburkholderia sp. WSM4180]